MERGRVVLTVAAGALALSGCQLKSGGENLVNGKHHIREACASSHPRRCPRTS
jgi:hypothetical protein